VVSVRRGVVGKTTGRPDSGSQPSPASPAGFRAGMILVWSRSAGVPCTVCLDDRGMGWPSGRRLTENGLLAPVFRPRAGKGIGMETIRWRAADLEAACQEAGVAGTLVLVDFFSPT
jgi:hypothetical protein